MKKIIQIITIIIPVTWSFTVNSQILKPGDAVVSVSPGLFANTVYCIGTTPVDNINYAKDTVLEVIRICKAPAPSATNNCWKMTPAEYTTLTYKHKDWIREKLGNIFGICIDDNRNIYVTSTGFYGQQYTGISTGSVFKINAYTGNISLLKDLHAANQTEPLSLGNIKFYAGKLFVSDLWSGKIFMLDAGTGSVLNTYDPLFTDGSKPCGLAIGNVGGQLKLFFSRNGFSSSTTSIYSINLNSNSSGGISFGSTLTPEISINSVYPITDIDINNRGDRMIFTQRTTTSWTSTTSAHSSNTYQFYFNGLNWVNTNNYFIGNYCQSPTNCNRNSTGGISFSPWIVGSNCMFSCDTSIAVTADRLDPGGSCGDVFGITNFNQNQTGSNQGVNFDVNNNTTICSKTFLGDVEVCDTILPCAAICACGKFTRATLNGNEIPNFNVPTPFGTSSNPDSYLLSMVKGNTSGEFHVTYQCEGACSAKTTWKLTNVNTGVLIKQGSDDGDIILDFNQFNRQECGFYQLEIIPACGDKPCDPLLLLLAIVCEPPTCCEAKIELSQPQLTVRPSSDPNVNSLLYSQINFTADRPMSEVRISVDEFRLSANSANCLLCKNRPGSWGNINSADLNGIPGKLFSGQLLSPVEAATDIREVVFSKGQQPLTLNPGKLNFSLNLPAITDLGCCEVNVYLCLKVTFKDVNCRECVRMICDTYVLNKVPVQNGTKKANQKPVIFTPIN